MPHPLLRLLPLLIPSWNFFRGLGEPHTLWILPENQAWRPALRRPPRAWTALFYNPQGNLFLAEQSAVENLLRELSDRERWPAAELRLHPAFALVESIARRHAGGPCRWKITIGQVDALLAPTGDSA